MLSEMIVVAQVSTELTELNSKSSMNNDEVPICLTNVGTCGKVAARLNRKMHAILIFLNVLCRPDAGGQF